MKLACSFNLLNPIVDNISSDDHGNSAKATKRTRLSFLALSEKSFLAGMIGTALRRFEKIESLVSAQKVDLAVFRALRVQTLRFRFKNRMKWRLSRAAKAFLPIPAHFYLNLVPLQKAGRDNFFALFVVNLPPPTRSISTACPALPAPTIHPDRDSRTMRHFL
jgi:hypothetical protein